MGLSLAEVRNKGWEILVKELGYSGATKFILLYDAGKGNYVESEESYLKALLLKILWPG